MVRRRREAALLDIYIDADACPVKNETYKVAERYGLQVIVVAADWMRAPLHEWIRVVAAGSDFDAADNWIAENVQEDDIVITADIPLAARCLEKKARVLDHRGGEFDEASIGDALASRELLSTLRETGEITGGPRPFDQRQRSKYLQELDRTINALRKKGAR
ncbi:MAG: YaiI/YqxD family protein [Gemmatimonadetes bacterium]|nr:YaiI/YqxD family protein [Gemmatimonadota bacterium]